MNAAAYHYVLPDGYEFKPQTRAKIDALVEKTGLSNEDVQAFIDIHVELMEEYAAALEKSVSGEGLVLTS